MTFFVFAAVSAAFLPNPSSKVSSHIEVRGAIIALGGDETRPGSFPVGACDLGGEVASCFPRIAPTRLAPTLADFRLPLDSLRCFFVGVGGSSKSPGALRLRGEEEPMA